MYIINLSVNSFVFPIESLSLNVANDLICDNVGSNSTEFKETQSSFEIVRVVITIITCVGTGLFSDCLSSYWDRSASRNKDVQKALVSYLVVLSFNILFAFSLLGTEIWPSLIFLSFCNGGVYVFETIGTFHGIIVATL